jgi:hypothetical protein
MFYLLIQKLIYRFVNHPIKPFPVITSTAMSETKPIIAKRPFQISAPGVKPHCQALRSVATGVLDVFVALVIISTPVRIYSALLPYVNKYNSFFAKK